jgi:hypothetical protein
LICHTWEYRLGEHERDGEFEKRAETHFHIREWMACAIRKA